LLETTIQDFRFALRQLRKSSVFTATAMSVLGLSIGACAAIFAFVDGALLRPLPYQEPSSLVALFETLPVGSRYHISYGDYAEWKRQSHAFVSLDIYRQDQFFLKTAAGVEDVTGAQVSDGFFRTLGVAPLLGRDFLPGEDLPTAPRTVLLSYETWHRRYGANQSVLGETAVLDGVPFVIIGVLPSGFHFAPALNAGFWKTLDPELVRAPRDGHPYYGVARLKPGVTLSAAYADLSPIARQIATDYPQANRDRGVTVLSLTDAILGDIRPTLVALLAGAGLLAFIGFVNVSSLILVRADNRRRELALRGALGASRLRLLRQLIVEGGLLATTGCGIGLLLAFFGVAYSLRRIPQPLLNEMPYLQRLGLNPHMVLFALVFSLGGTILFSSGPALQLFFNERQPRLLEGGRAAAGRTWRRLGASLVVAELAITVVLLMSAGLLVRSFYRLLHEDVGIATNHLSIVHVIDADNPSEAQSLARVREVTRALASLPGSIAAGAAQEAPLTTGERSTKWIERFRVIGRVYPGLGDEADMRYVSAGYFEALRARLLRGRCFTDGDDLTKPRVAMINRTMARQVFPGQDPLGKILVGQWDKEHPVQIVGVVDDVREGALDAVVLPVVYRALQQNPTGDFYVALRTSPLQQEKAFLAQMVRAVHQVSPGLIADGETMADRINNSEAAYLHRSAAWLIAGFAALALTLGSVGLYGVISYAVGQRTREIGVRMALGAQRSSVYRLIMTEACLLAVLGALTGLVAYLGAARILRSMLFATSPWDKPTMLLVLFVLSAATLLAAWLPARRAASINPTEALRAE
jgi:macrolide transport system ATP-binding/permease protein